MRLSKITCGDAYDFLMDLGLHYQEMIAQERETGDGRQQKGYDGQRLPDHVIMNYPLEAPRFLGALRWWPSPKKRTSRVKKNSKKRQVTAKDGRETSSPRVHVYTFARADEENSRSAEEVSVDIIASYLIPGLDARELDATFDCNVDVYCVRDVAPGKQVFCVSFSATPRLLRYMQGDF